MKKTAAELVKKWEDAGGDALFFSYPPDQVITILASALRDAAQLMSKGCSSWPECGDQNHRPPNEWDRLAWLRKHGFERAEK